MNNLESEVTKEYVSELKARLHILHNHDDDNMKNLIKMGHARIQGYVGDFPLTLDFGRDLVFEYARFVYNNQTEWFYSSFHSELVSLTFNLMKTEETNNG